MERQYDPPSVSLVNSHFHVQSSDVHIVVSNDTSDIIGHPTDFIAPDGKRYRNLRSEVIGNHIKKLSNLGIADKLRTIQGAINAGNSKSKYKLNFKGFGKAADRVDQATTIIKGISSGKPKKKRKTKKILPIQHDTLGDVPMVGDPNLCSSVTVSKTKTKKKTVSKAKTVYTQSKEEIVTFVNADDAPCVGEIAGNHAFSTTDKTSDTEIHDFFARPVRIDSYTWLESQTFGTVLRTIDPWSLWANNTAVKNKLNNYSWFRGDLHLKFQMTASPFYYGQLKQIYRPLPTLKSDTISIDPGTRYLIPYSQRPHIDMTVGEGDSFEMICPFLYPANWINVQSASTMSGLGQLKTLIYAQLDSANGTTGTGIGITVYAWVENIELSGASVGLSMQSGEDDEFGQGPVSNVASWVASAATYLEDVPIIGPFASATRIGAGAIGAIASMFGFTNVPVIEDTKPYRPEGAPKLASAEIGFPVERMSLDPKNELSVDPRIVGLNSGIDEMSLQYIATRESYLTTCTWSTSNLVDDTLFYGLVNPTLYDNDNGTNPAIYMTPMAFVAKAFKDWRGSIIFRFEIIASKYHKGKLRIVFDPSGYSTANIGNTAVTSNIAHTAIVDIGETTNVEFHVPYQQALQFLTNRTDYSVSNIKYANNTTLTPANFAYNPDYDNGYIILRVLTPLTAPVASSSVRINTYVRAGTDFEYANPTTVDELCRLSRLVPQSAEQVIEGSPDAYELGPTGGTANRQYLVHYGENIRSFRQLLHRYELNSVEWISPPAATGTPTTDYAVFNKYFYKFPRYMGYMTSSTVNALGTGGAGSYGYNFVIPTLLTYLAPAYLAYRGSINWTFNTQCSQKISRLRVYKDNNGSLSARVASQVVSCNTVNKANALMYQTPNSGASASALTNQGIQPIINVQCTNFSRYKFQITEPVNSNTGSSSDGSDLDAYVLEGTFQAPVNTAAPVIIESYCATGPDFGLYFFLNVPVYWNYIVAPTPI